MALSHGGEKSIFQNEVHGDEMVEMEDMFSYKRMKISILFQNIGTKKY
jgi:hypothetical protein